MNQFGCQKILKHLDRVAEWQKTGLSRPITYELDMTNICNSKCSFCFGFYNRQSDTSSLTLPEVKDIITQVKNYGGKGLTFTGGGEPLCNPSTVDAVRFARDSGLDVGFITNGILLDDEKAATLVDCCTWIRVSVDAGTKEIYQRTHGLNGESFRKITENIALLVKKKRERQSKVTIGTGFITFPDITGDMLAYVRLSRDLGVDYAQFRPLLKSFSETEINTVPDNETLAMIRECQKLATGSFAVLCSLHKYESMKNGTALRNYTTCYGHNFAAVISANKKMYVCCHMRGIEKYCVGDLNKNSLEEIWKSVQRRQASGNIDFADCPLLCRCDGFNTILWNIMQPGDHVNFL
jgi:MoaA/NifB/PqqE/SkfB family radical SAM enzyme